MRINVALSKLQYRDNCSSGLLYRKFSKAFKITLKLIGCDKVITKHTNLMIFLTKFCVITITLRINWISTSVHFLLAIFNL